MKFYLFPYEIFRNIFRLVYNYCANTNNLSNHGRSNKIQKVTNAVEDGQIVGKDLYMNIKNYLTNYLNKICQVKFYINFFKH